MNENYLLLSKRKQKKKMKPNKPSVLFSLISVISVPDFDKISLIQLGLFHTLIFNIHLILLHLNSINLEYSFTKQWVTKKNVLKNGCFLSLVNFVAMHKITVTIEIENKIDT